MAATTTLKDLLAPLAPAITGVKTILLNTVPPEAQVLSQGLRHALNTDGKLLRPVLTLMGYQLLNNSTDLPENLLKTAAVSEMIHLATLLHDDVLDDAAVRRGRPTVRALLGNKMAILSGDYLLAHASLTLAQVGNMPLVALYSQVLADLCDGEALQMQQQNKIGHWAAYYRKNYLKTASLFAAAAQAPALLLESPPHVAEAMAKFGENFGLAFQLMDDLLDYTSTAQDLGKPVLNDLSQGIMNAPILWALDALAAHPTQKQAFEQALQQVINAHDHAPQAMSDIHRVLQETNALEKTVDLAEEKIATGLLALQPFFTAGPALTQLEALAKFALTRTH